MRCWRVVIGGLVSEGYQVIGSRVLEETPTENGWAEVVPFVVRVGMRRQGQGQGQGSRM